MNKNSIPQYHLELLEDLPLDPYDKWYVFLNYIGLKSGTWATLSSEVWREGDEPKHVSSETISTVTKSLTELGLLYQYTKRVTHLGLMQPDNERTRYNELCDVFIARDQPTLNTLTKSIDLQTFKHNHLKLGAALGYPQTAVEAFLDPNTKCFTDDLDAKTQLSEAAQFANFTLSKKHWKDELAIVQNWINQTKKIAPVIWDDICRAERPITDSTVALVLRAHNSDSL